MIARAAVIAEAREWIGTPWRHQASRKGIGADCIGYIAGVAARVGSEEGRAFLGTQEWRNYGRHPDQAFMFKVADGLMDRIDIASAGVADVLLFSCGKHPMHWGMIAPDGNLLHSYLVARRVAEHRLDQGWRARIVRAYRIRGVA